MKTYKLRDLLFQSLTWVQIVLFAIILLLYLGLYDDLTPQGLSHDRAVSMLMRAAQNGAFERIEIGTDQADYFSSHTRLYGVANADGWLKGSTLQPFLTDINKQIYRLDEARFTLSIREGQILNGQITKVTLEGQVYLVATAGNQADLLDVLAYASQVFGRVFVFMLPLLGASLWVTWWVLQRGIRPVEELAVQAGEIGLGSLDRHLSADRLPNEILPLVTSFNDGLDRLSASFKSHKRFLDNAAHELKTPLTLMRVHIEGLPVPNLKAPLLQKVQQLTSIVDQLLASARLSSVWAPPHQPVELSILTRDIVADYAPLVHSLKRSIEFRNQSDASSILGHASGLRAAISNLIDNAIRAEPEGGVIELIIQPGPKILVVDHGAGLDPADLASAIMPFWRRDESSRGSGLGLAIVHEMLRLHQAKLTVEPTLGGGATFTADFSASERPVSFA